MKTRTILICWLLTLIIGSIFFSLINDDLYDREGFLIIFIVNFIISLITSSPIIILLNLLNTFLNK